MSLENKNQSSTPWQNEVSPPVCCRILYFLAIDNERENTSTTNRPKKNFTKLQERRRFFLRHSKEIRENSVCTAKKMQCTFPKTTIVHCLAPQKIGRETCVDLKQARPSVAKVAQIAYEVAEQFHNCKHSRQWKNTTTQEDGAATRQLY